MPLLRTLTALLAVASSVTAQGAVAFSGSGPFPAGRDYLQDAETVAEKTVPFDLYFPNKGEAPRWELSTRLDVAAPPDSRISNAQVLNTVYDFKLPGGQNLTEAVADNSGHLSQENFCVTILETLLPASEAKRYDPKLEKNASDRSCEKPFQKECLRIINRLMKERKPAAPGCRFSNIDLNEIKQCEWIFGDTTKTSTFNLLEPGLDLTGGFAHITSDLYDGSNSTFVDVAEKRIHMVAIESGSTFTPLCVKINTEKK
ncbi:hypothetical protein Slin15195_G079670 [Septoria linicola]|uniref:Secreted protein n=1 Tax=Septoria linicola TaxID=215465 RepID=A0A9Q9EMN6_9PEZI|nr:hypothetical protein Slin15195_G079670 [Septoria linicola]